MHRVLGASVVVVSVGVLWTTVTPAADGAAAAAPLAILGQAPSELADTGWRLVEFRSMDDAIGTEVPADPSLYTLQLAEDGTVAMRLNCNRATGTWSATAGDDPASGSFTFGRLALTRALCPPPSMDQRIARDAEYIRSYMVRDGRLYLSLMADGGIYAWEPDPASPFMSGIPAAPGDGGPRGFEVISGTEAALREQPASTAAVVISFAPGTLLTNLGCERGDGQVWCFVQEMGGGPVGFVAAESVRPAVSPDGSIATGADDSALRAGQEDFDARGSVPCAWASGQPMTQCEFAVARSGGGYATVVITRPDEVQRVVFFQMGRPIGHSVAQADGSAALEFSATKEGDLNLVRIGDERYEIPDAVILGG